MAAEIEDYPNNFEEFLDQFKTEDDCIEYIQKIRWPDGFVCPQCQATKAWTTSRGLLHCSECRHDTSVTVGTVFEGTQKPLRVWFHVMWMLMAQKTGVSAKNLKEFIGFGSYQTIWGWLHKLRSVMVCPGRDRLRGSVEVDETYIGGKEKGKRGRGAENKVLVAVAIERVNDKLGRVRFRCIEDASEENLIPFVCDMVEPGSKVITDGWLGYTNLSDNGYVHDKRTIKESSLEAYDLLPNVHLVITLVKRWLRGTHQGAVRPSHLQDYLDEYAFRFNRRLSTHRGKLFYRLMQQAVSTTAPGIKELYKI
jgi:transposase-like protein